MHPNPVQFDSQFSYCRSISSAYAVAGNTLTESQNPVSLSSGGPVGNMMPAYLSSYISK